MKEAELPLTRRIDAHRIGDKGFVEKLILTEAERLAVIRAYDLLDLPVFSAEFELKPWRKNGVIVKGRLRARAVQPCVSTLEPVAQEIDEPFEIFFLPTEAAGGKSAETDALEVDIDFEGDDPPETFENGRIDLAAVALEQFALALDPYPRAKAAQAALPLETEGKEAAIEDKPPSPFAVLSRLKDKPQGGNGSSNR